MPALIYRRIVGLTLAAVLSACGESRLPVEPRTSPPAPPTTVAPGPALAGTYDRISASSSGGPSRYVLRADSTFVLQYLGGRPFEYAGKYSRADSLITFSFDASNIEGRWSAEATLRGAYLTVRYNWFMTQSDFDDGVYLRSADERK